MHQRGISLYPKIITAQNTETEKSAGHKLSSFSKNGRKIEIPASHQKLNVTTI